MEIGIGLPNAVPGTEAADLVEWARRADARGFSTLGTIDRVVYDNYEPLLVLAAAAAVTERIGLCTSVLLGPLRPNPTELAKEALTLNSLSQGRFTLGIGLGARGDDYEASGIETAARGKRLNGMLERIREVWEGEAIGPHAAGGAPGLVVGGHADASFARAARFGDGWIAGGAPPDQYREMVEQFKSAWSQAGREGQPRTMALAYFSLGERAAEDANEYLTHYYAFLGEETAGYIASSAVQDAETVQQYLSAFEQAGCGELILFPSSSDPQQVDLLADAAGL